MGLGNGMGNPWVLLSVPVPAPTHTRNPWVTSDGSGGYGFHQVVGSIFLYLIIYLITITKPPYEVLVGMDQG